MKIFQATYLMLLLLVSFNIRCQIMIGESTETKNDTLIKLKNDIAPKREIDGSTELFIGTTWTRSFRILEENGENFGLALGKRADETFHTTWSYSIGFRNYLAKNFCLEGGISLLKNGESYRYKDTDSSFNYQTTYSYIAMPIKALFFHGDAIRLLGGIGIIPQMFQQYRQEQQWINSVDESETASIKTKNDYNTFVISACLNAGIQIQYSRSWSIYILPEYRIQLNNSNSAIDPYKHYARSSGVNFGFVYQL